MLAVGPPALAFAREELGAQGLVNGAEKEDASCAMASYSLAYNLFMIESARIIFLLFAQLPEISMNRAVGALMRVANFAVIAGPAWRYNGAVLRRAASVFNVALVVLVAAGCGDDGSPCDDGCQAAPAAECADASTLLTYLSPGQCVADACVFEHLETHCNEGCVDGVCQGCEPTTCDAQGWDCGQPPDGCGGLLTCGQCSAPETCGGGGQVYLCGQECTPRSCTAADLLCEPVDDGCGGTMYCTNQCAGCEVLQASPGDPCCAGVSGHYACSADGGLTCAVTDEIATFTVAHALPGNRQSLDDWHDRAVFAATIQGIVNRDSPQLFIDGMDHDATWWPRLTAAGQLLEGTSQVALSDPVDLYQRFACALNGLVVWDPAVRATLNVATSVAGAEDLAQVRYDTRSTSLYQQLITSVAPPAVVVDLTGKFTGSGTVPDTSRASSGSAKCDAYLWLLERYVKPGLLDWHYAGYLVDAWWLDHPLGPNTTQAFNRDFLVAQRAVVFDLSNWADEVPIDDPAQPLGTDRSTLLELLRGIYDLHAGAGITQVTGFTPWAWKYTNYPGAGGSHGPVATEWDLARILSAYNAVIDADALSMTTLANASLYAQALLPQRRVPPAAPTPRRLRDLGAWDNRLVNAGFDDNNHVGSWSVALSNYLTITEPGGAHAGVNFLHARAVGDVPPNSLAQDVAVGVQAGETVHGSIYVRVDSGAGDVTLALWGLGATQESTTQLRSLTAADGWQRLEVSLTASHAHANVRLELFLPLGGPQLRVDSAALWVKERPVGVTPRHYVVWHMGDYDAAAWLYQMLPSRWDGTRRGEVPLSWAFNANLMDRFRLGFAHLWDTATERDFFSGGDTVAGYVNVTQLYGARSPSGLGDGRSAFEQFARPYLQRMGITDTIFALNGSSGAFDDSAYELLGRLTGRGVAFNMAGQPSPGPFLAHGVAFVGQDSDLDSGNQQVSADRVYTHTAGAAPGFHVFRSVLATPGFASDLTQKLFADHPERLLTVLAPDALFTLLLLHLGETPEYRLAWVADNLPAVVSAGQSHALEVTVRNDGWDTWTAPGFRLGVHFTRAPAAILPRTLPSDAAGYPHRFALPNSVAPGQSVTFTGTLPIPVQPGAYTVQLDLVQEGVTWFETRRNLPWQTSLFVQ